MSHDVFISYSNKNIVIADAVCAKLEENKIRVWIAPRDVQPGKDFAAAIIHAIDHCQIFVLIWSEESNKSEHILNEINRAFSQNITVIPFRIDNVEPTESMEYYIGRTHWLDAMTPPLEKHIKLLAETILTNLGRQVEIKPGIPLVKEKEVHEEKKNVGVNELQPATIPAGKKVNWIPIAAGLLLMAVLVVIFSLGIFKVSPPAVEVTITQSALSIATALPAAKTATATAQPHLERVTAIPSSTPINLTKNKADDKLPQWSPDGKKIGFSSNRDGNYAIYVMNTDGSNPTHLTNNPADDYRTTWSPDGRKIAFLDIRDGNCEIYMMNADGSNPINLTKNKAAEFDPAWSPDGKRIAFSSNRDGNYEIYVMNADGNNPINLTNNPATDYRPAWSPDGQKIAFDSNRDGNYEIYVMNSDGSNPTRLTNNKADDISPEWSPDGQRIVFESARDGNLEIYEMNADGSNPINLTNNKADDEFPAWSADGQKIAFQSNRDGNYEIYVMNAPTAVTQ